jgi:endonuclease YncB( thermonuclease family)
MIGVVLAAVIYQGTVVKTIDGDTLKVAIKGFPAPFNPIDVRVYGLDTPEHIMPPAQTVCEVALGKAAAGFAAQLVKVGDKVKITWDPAHKDKFGRLLGRVTLSDGRDWANTMIVAGFGRSYGEDGNLHKSLWCSDTESDIPH